VNVAGGQIDDSVKPGISLAEKLGQVLFGMADASLVSVEVEVRGEIVVHDVSVLKLAALKGIFMNAVDDQVSYVNAPLLAEARGVKVTLTTDKVSEEYRNMTTLRAVLSDGNVISVSGTVIGPKRHEKIIGINGYDVELALAEHLVLMVYSDRPGIVAVYGKAFADAKVNIAAMQIARQQKGGKALSVITVDSPIDQKVLDKLKGDIDAEVMKAITITSH
jgi:D-3-phosphoglycerate dehydrogenase